MTATGWLPACAPKSSPKPETPNPAVSERKSRITKETLQATQQIKTTKFTVYYFGTAEGRYNADRSDWVGTVTGDVLYLGVAEDGQRQRLQGPDVTMTIGHGQVATKGRARTSFGGL